MSAAPGSRCENPQDSTHVIAPPDAPAAPGLFAGPRDADATAAAEIGRTAFVVVKQRQHDAAKVRELHHLVTSPGSMTDAEIIAKARRIIAAEG